MEDPFEKLSNQYRTLFYAIQLKATDTAKTLRTIAGTLTENQIKTLTSQQLNIFAMTEKMFNQHANNHLYQLLKMINSNLNSMVVLLIQRVQKLTQKIAITQKLANEQSQHHTSKHEAEETIEKQCSFSEFRINKLGGVPLLNENYSRYLEDHRILQQIKQEKEERILKKKTELLSCMIYKQLNHRTDVEGEPTSNDEIAKYIIQSRNKDSVYNYVPYQPQLQQILTFFQNSQRQANNFLNKKSNSDPNQSNGKFSFADFQRDVQFSNRQFQKKVMEKLTKLVEKLKEKELQIQQREKQRQAYFQQIQKRSEQSEEKCIQTQFEFNQFIRQYQNQCRDLQLKCDAFQGHKVEEIKYIQKENELNSQLTYKSLQLQKMEAQIQNLEAVIMSLKKMVRVQKSKKHITIKDQYIEKEQLNDDNKKEKESSIGSQLGFAFDDPPSLNSNIKLRKTSNRFANWARRTSNDGVSLTSYSQSQPFEREQLSRGHGRKLKYNLQSSKYSNIEQDAQIHKSKGVCFKFNQQLKLKESAIQTELKDELDQQHLIQSQKVNVVNDQQDQSKDSDFGTNIESKSSKIRFENKLEQNILTSLSNIDRNTERSRQRSAKKQHSSTNKKQFKQSKQNLQLIEKKTSLPKQRQKTLKKSTSLNSTPLASTPPKENLELTKRKSNQNPKKPDIKQKNEEVKLSKEQTQSTQFKDQNVYKMFQVVEQDAEEQKQSNRNTLRGSLIEAINNPNKKIDNPSLQNLEKQLKKIKSEKNYFSQQIYNLTIKPSKQLQKLMSLPSFGKSVKNHPFCQRSDGLKKLRNSTQTSQPLVIQTEKNMNKILESLDRMRKIKVGGDRNSLHKLNNLKKKIQAFYKANLLSRIDIQNIANILHITHNSCNSVIENKIYSNIKSVDQSHRKSLPQLEQQMTLNYESGKKYTSFRHNSLNEQFHHSITKGQDELKLEEIIVLQALNHDFCAKFERLHKGCQEVGLCSHVTKYFEVIMKHFEQVKQKQKNLLALHVQNIGKVTAQQYKQAKKIVKTEQSSVIQSRDNAENKIGVIDTRYQGKSLQKIRKSKLSMLPNIKQGRNSLYSP